MDYQFFTQNNNCYYTIHQTSYDKSIFCLFSDSKNFDSLMPEAFLWWNAVVNYEENLDTPPERPGITEMNIIWQELSPIFHTHCNEGESEEMYWEDVYKCLCTLADNQNVGDPRTDFSAFVESLYSYRNLIKITDLDGAIYYAQRFCPKENSNFFVHEFLFAVSDPFLTVEAIDKLNSLNIEPWKSYIQQPGAIERIFDLFITFLQPANRTVENEYESFRVMLANLMTTLICESNNEVFRKQQYAASLYSRLLNLIIYSQTDASVSFARCAIQLNKKFLKEYDADERAKRIVALLNASTSNKLSHAMTTLFAVSQGSITIPNYILAQQLSKNIQTEFDLNTVVSINRTGKEAKFIVMRSVAQTMVQSKLLMRLAAKYLVEIMSSLEDQDLIEWIQKFFLLIFVYIKIASKKEKYIRRLLMLCEIISTEQFLSATFAKKIILPCANTCYLKGGCDFLTYYFPLGSDLPQSNTYSRELSRYEKMRFKLKTFPFKNNSNMLVEGSRNRKNSNGEVPLEMRAIINDFADLGISERAKPYLYRRSKLSVIDQQNTIFTLEDFIDQNKSKAEKIKNKSRHKRSSVNPDLFTTEGILPITGLRSCMYANEAQLYDFQYKILMDFTNIAHELISVLKQLPGLNADIRLLQYDMQHFGLEDNYYKSLKDQRAQLRKLIPIYSRKYTAPKYIEEIFGVLSQGGVKFDQNLQYAPPNELDTVLVEYIQRSSYKEIMNATAMIIEDGTLDGAVSTIWELNNSIIEDLKMTFNQNAMILYMSLIRAIFDNAYALNPRPHLNRYSKANKEFLEKARKFIEQPISLLNLSETIVGAKRVNQPIYSLMLSSKYSFEHIQFLTNPIDILYQIHLQCQQLFQLSSTGTLSPPDHQMLILALVASTPPSNAVSIAIFLEKWGNLFSNATLSKSKRMFIDAVSGIINIVKITDDS
ncbi:hypothetical protein TVAG_413080 [Trichomonas vaginalis G3]|uniref:Uncharacterized protein n=1 Tax=Trichomonas vaginalis (strain ATCC PRA-98 / G3) TaxID=412133 RepID=A2F6J2_TRIV3|nr:hypothetical protein TVAGG3_0002080 [Trichomonas vaginalis G3]EAX99490.1 hypothetical protein TVAG_413080 [Trichomonas vaginalis G3]KAI5538686.1 hypothetical protein TVAGG3_0002080 [Trichomonas vaginalis G3]|eukprot:XP_001312420.1 hypothetical protein [Trichomonas vaginalis G3]